MEPRASGAPNAARISEIRMIALGLIHTKYEEISCWPYIQELNALKRRPLSVPWLEAMIMLAVIGRVRPSRVYGFLNKLRDRRRKHGDIDLFDRFEAMIRAYLAPENLTNHSYTRPVFADLDHGRLWAHVSDLIGALGAQGYTAFLNSGTLLGVVRDQRLIAHDDDIDLAVLLQAQSEKDAAAEWRALKDQLIAKGLFDHDTHRDPAIYKLKPLDGTQIDLFPAWVQGDQVFVYPHTHGELSAVDVLPLQPCAVTGHAVPANPAKMLSLNYGPEWEVPDPLFKFPWAAANARFAPFLERLAP